LRNTKLVQIQSDDPNNRDRGKTFIITEMPVFQAEKFAARAWLAVCNANVSLSEEESKNVVTNAGWAGLAFLSLRALGNAKYADIEPLMDEMMTYIKIIRDLKNSDMSYPVMESDLEEISTLITLRKEFIDLHTGFFSRGAGSLASAWAPSPQDS
jgi:hypothetical protein